MPRYGIDTSILVRLLTGDPADEFERTRAAFEQLLQEEPSAEIQASNLVIAEAYFVLQHHYGVGKPEARSALDSVLTSGLVHPLHGPSVLEALKDAQEPGLLDRLIVVEYADQEVITLTHDRKMGRLPRCRLL